MTTRYVDDLQSITKLGYCALNEYAGAVAAGVPASSAAAGIFDQLSGDVEESFRITIGVHRALVAVIEAIPATKDKAIAGLKKEARDLLASAVRNFEFLDDQFYAYQLRRKTNPYRAIVARVGERMSAGFAVRNALVLSVDALAIPDALKPAVRAVFQRAATDYELLAEQFRAFAGEPDADDYSDFDEPELARLVA